MVRNVPLKNPLGTFMRSTNLLVILQFLLAIISHNILKTNRAKMATVYTDCIEMLLLPDKSQKPQQKICAWPFSIIQSLKTVICDFRDFFSKSRKSRRFERVLAARARDLLS